MATEGLLVRMTDTGTHLYPLDEPVSSLPFLDQPLHAFQKNEAERAGFAFVEQPASMPLPAGTTAWCGADVVFRAETLRALADAAHAAGRPCCAAVPRHTPLWHFVSAFGQTDRLSAEAMPFPLVAGPLEGLVPDRAFFEGLQIIPLCDETTHEEVRVPPYGAPPHVLRIPMVTRLLGQVTHWLHLLNLNQALLQSVRSARGTRGNGNIIDGNVRAHPSALVEGSILSDGVEIEQSASVLECFLGKNVKIGDHAIFQGCVIGAGCHTLVDTHMRRVVALPGSTLSNLGVEDLLIGRDSFLTTAVAFFAGGPGQNVQVEGQDSGRAVLSGAIGNRCILGARALFQSGMTVPSGTVIVMRPDEGLSKLDEKGLARASMMLGDHGKDV